MGYVGLESKCNVYASITNTKSHPNQCRLSFYNEAAKAIAGFERVYVRFNSDKSQMLIMEDPNGAKLQIFKDNNGDILRVSVTLLRATNVTGFKNFCGMFEKFTVFTESNGLMICKGDKTPYACPKPSSVAKRKPTNCDSYKLTESYKLSVASKNKLIIKSFIKSCSDAIDKGDKTEALTYLQMIEDAVCKED